MKTIAILTSGGDAPGMNACIRSIARTCIYNGIRVMGIRSGYDGLMNGNIYEMNVSSVADIIHRGGTILGSARYHTDYTIGFFTAVETVSDAISKIRDTSSSHGRANIIEVMGRNCGDIALYSGVASGAESILVPEVELNIDEVTEKIERGRKRGKLHHLIMLAEGVGGAYDIKDIIEEKTGVETKVTILGHVQRGGTPCTFDRLMATQMGNLAVKLIMEEKTGLAIAMKDNKIITVPIDEAVATKRNFREDLYEISKEISI